MKNNGSRFERFLLLASLWLFATFIFQRFLGGNKPTGNVAPRNAQTLAKAFAGIAPGNGSKLSAAQAQSELKTLDADIKKNDSDDYAYWARLRAGLIQQYGLNGGDAKANLKAARDRYQQVIDHGAANDVGAQATFQKGDSQWRESAPNPPTGEALQTGATTLEMLIHSGRGPSQFLDKSIFVPQGADKKLEPQLGATQLPPAFASVKVGDLQNVKQRVNSYYASTWQYKLFDAGVNLLGRHRDWSYGLTIVIFAIFTRVLMQPFTKKSYESMKNMGAIAPEMKKIQDKYKDKKDQTAQMKMMGEIRELQKLHGVNPYLGCVLVLPQLLLFLFVVSPFIQHYEVQMEIAGATFGWITNLARPDLALLVFYTLSQFVSIRLSATPPADEQQRQMQVMSTFMPFAFAFFLLQWPSAFTLYWMTYNVLSTFLQWRLLKAADPSKHFWTVLTSNPFAKAPSAVAVGAGSTDAIPPRPKAVTPKPTNPKASVKTLNPDAPAFSKPSKNGALNGTLDGVAALDGADLNGADDSALDDSPRDNDAPNENGANRNGASSSANAQRSRRRRRH